MQGHGLFVWAHVFSHGNNLVLDNENIGAIGNRPYSRKLTKEQLASFYESLNWEALCI